MASKEKEKQKRRSTVSRKTPKSPTTPTSDNQPKRKSSSASRSAFPTQENSVQALRQKLGEYETQIKSLTRDNKVLARKIEKMETNTQNKNKKIDSEKDMRLKANQDRYWLRQKLERLQKAIEARLKMLGIDFSNINDLGEALEAAFSAIQKLAAELAKKEEELQAMSDKFNRAKEQHEDALKEVDKLNRKVEKGKNANDDLKKRLQDKDRALSEVEKQTDSMGDREKKQKVELDKLRKELEALRASKNKQFDDFVDKKAELDKKYKDKERECKEIGDELNAQKKQNEKLELAHKALQDEMEKLRALMDKTQSKLMEEKEKNKELTKQVEDLQNELDDANRRNAQLKKENDALNDELAKLKALLAEKEKEIADLNAKFDAFRKQKEEEAEAMRAQFEEQKAMADALKKKLANMEKKMKEQEDTINAQDNELSNLRQALEDEQKAKAELQQNLDRAGKDNNATMDALTAEKDSFKDMIKDLRTKNKNKDDEIAALKAALADAEKKLADYLNRPRDDKETQTELSGKWIENAKMQLSNLDNIFKENEDLRKLASKNDERLLELAEENKVLLDEIDVLLKQQAAFKPDTSNHRGEVVAMVASTNNYMAATSGVDKSVRLWQIDPKAEKHKDQVLPVYRAQMEGIALSLAYTKDGSYLVAGCAYRNGPEGLLIIWNMLKGDGEVEFLFRSRPSVRFGRAHCVRWSDDNKYIFSGDTTGSVWIWDVERQIQLAEVRAHKDVVHDIGVAGDALFTCSLDQTIAAFDLKRLTAKNNNKKRRSVKKKGPADIHVPDVTVYKAKQLDKNEKYPYQVLQPTEDGATLIAGARKLWAFKFSGFMDTDDAKSNVSNCALDKKAAPRLTDTDTDFVQTLQVRRGLVVISRRDFARAKIFNTNTGAEEGKAKFKNNVKKIQFTFDTQNCVVCCQAQDGKKCKPPTMHLWNYKK